MNNDELPSLTLLVPARNEEHVVIEALSRSLQLPLKQFDVIVVENASTDQTHKLLQEMFQLRLENGIYRSITHPHLRMLRSGIPGKALAPKITGPQSIQGNSNAIEIGNWNDPDGYQNIIEKIAKHLAPTN